MIRKFPKELFVFKLMPHVGKKGPFGSQLFYFLYRLLYAEVGPVGFVPQRAEYKKIKPRELFVGILGDGAAVRNVTERPDPVAEYLPVVMIDVDWLYPDSLEPDLPVYLLEVKLGFSSRGGEGIEYVGEVPLYVAEGNGVCVTVYIH